MGTPHPHTRMTRKDDERTLAMLQLRRNGITSRQIAKLFDLPRPESVRVITGRVIRDDVAYSGEPEHAVRAAYG